MPFVFIKYNLVDAMTAFNGNRVGSTRKAVCVIDREAHVFESQQLCMPTQTLT